MIKRINEIIQAESPKKEYSKLLIQAPTSPMLLLTPASGDSIHWKSSIENVSKERLRIIPDNNWNKTKRSKSSFFVEELTWNLALTDSDIEDVLFLFKKFKNIILHYSYVSIIELNLSFF